MSLFLLLFACVAKPTHRELQHELMASQRAHQLRLTKAAAEQVLLSGELQQVEEENQALQGELNRVNRALAASLKGAPTVAQQCVVTTSVLRSDSLWAENIATEFAVAHASGPTVQFTYSAWPTQEEIEIFQSALRHIAQTTPELVIELVSPLTTHNEASELAKQVLSITADSALTIRHPLTFGLAALQISVRRSPIEVTLVNP